MSKEVRGWREAKIEADLEMDQSLATLPFTISVSSSY